MYVYNDDKFRETTIVVDSRDFMLDKAYQGSVRKFIRDLGKFQGMNSDAELQNFETVWFVEGSFCWYVSGRKFRLVTSVMIDRGLIER